MQVVDANVILRYLLSDHPDHHRQAAAFWELVKAGDEAAWIAESVLAECVYVLAKFHKAPRREVASSLTDLLSLRGAETDYPDAMKLALKLFAERNLDFVDAMVFALAKAKEAKVFSFDRDLLKLERNP